MASAKPQASARSAARSAGISQPPEGFGGDTISRVLEAAGHDSVLLAALRKAIDAGTMTNPPSLVIHFENADEAETALLALAKTLRS